MAIGIEDLVVLSREATIIGIIAMASPVIDTISNMDVWAEAHNLGSIIIGIITMVIHILPEAGVPHLVVMHEDMATNVTIIIIEVDNHGVRIRDQNRQQYVYDNNYFTHTVGYDNVNSSDPRS